MTWLEAPDLASAARFLGESLPSLALNGHSIVLIGRCRVDYRGRADSRLDDGDRIVVVKSDGTLLVHNPEGLKPVNWQPPGCAFSVRTDQDRVTLVANRRRPPEMVEIAFARLDLAGAAPMRAGTPLELNGTEFDIRDALRARPELIEPGFVPWERERLTERGPMDLYGEDARGRRVIVEVKRVKAGLAEATQLWRYVETERKKRGVDVRGILAAPAISDRALLLLKDHGLEFREIHPSRIVPPKAASAPHRGQPTLLGFDEEPERIQTKTN